MFFTVMCCISVLDLYKLFYTNLGCQSPVFLQATLLVCGRVCFLSKINFCMNEEQIMCLGCTESFCCRIGGLLGGYTTQNKNKYTEVLTL